MQMRNGRDIFAGVFLVGNVGKGHEAYNRAPTWEKLRKGESLSRFNFIFKYL